MNAGQSLETVAKMILEQRSTKRDFISPTTAAEMLPSGQIVLDTGSSRFTAKPTHHALLQIASRHGIPARYMDKMNASSPELVATNVNHWFRKESEVRLFRNLKNPASPDTGTLRAFLSRSYRPLDNADLAEAALPTLNQLGARVESCAVTDNRLYIQAVLHQLEGEVAVGDTVRAGVIISNSEVGAGSLSIELMAWRLVCKNGMVVGNVISKYHVGRRHDNELREAVEFFSDATRQADDRAFFMKVRDAIRGVFNPERFAAVLESLKAGTKVELKDPVKAVEVITERFGLSESENHNVLNHLAAGNNLTQWGLANAVTYEANRVEDYDRAVQLERLGWEVATLNPEALN